MWGRIFAAAVVVAIVAAAAWALWPKPIVVETATIERRDLIVAVEEEGTSQIREIFSVSAPVTGRLKRLAIHPGDVVVANQTVVASIEPAAPGLLDDRSRRIAEATAQAAEAGVALGNNEMAITAYRKLLSLEPPEPWETHYQLAKLLHARGNADVEAKRNVLQALEDAPRFRDAQRLLLDLERNSPQPQASAAASSVVSP